MMIEAKGLTKIFDSGGKNVVALSQVNLQIQKGDFAMIKGPSGCGKSTLLFLLGGLLKPSSGDIHIDGENLYMLSEKERNNYRSSKIALVFQSYHLIPYLSIMDNILLLNKIKGIHVTKEEIITLAKNVNIQDRLDHKPSELSVGEKQRASLVRALVVKPDIILADEPTGNLDSKTGAEVLDMIDHLNEQGKTIVGLDDLRDGQVRDKGL